MRDRKFQLVRLCARHADGSFATVTDRLRYPNQLRHFKAQCHRTGIDRTRGLRCAYAQGHFMDPTDRPRTHAGGPVSVKSVYLGR